MLPNARIMQGIEQGGQIMAVQVGARFTVEAVVEDTGRAA